MNKRVVIEVEGGCAYVAECPDDIDVIIRDWDNIEAGDEDPLADEEKARSLMGERFVVRRTFEAKKHPAGSDARRALNEHSETSEYMPSYRYVLNRVDANSPPAFRTKTEAQAAADKLNSQKGGTSE